MEVVQPRTLLAVISDIGRAVELQKINSIRIILLQSFQIVFFISKPLSEYGIISFVYVLGYWSIDIFSRVINHCESRNKTETIDIKKSAKQMNIIA